MYIGHGRVCVCLSLATFPHYCTDLDVTWGMVGGVPASCSLMGGFAIGVRSRCYDNIVVSDIAIFVLKRDVKLQLTNYDNIALNAKCQ